MRRAGRARRCGPRGGGHGLDTQGGREHGRDYGWEERCGVGGSRAPTRPVEPLAAMDLQELLGKVPYSDVFVNAQSWGEGSGGDELAFWEPFAV